MLNLHNKFEKYCMVTNRGISRNFNVHSRKCPLSPLYCNWRGERPNFQTSVTSFMTFDKIGSHFTDFLWSLLFPNLFVLRCSQRIKRIRNTLLSWYCYVLVLTMKAFLNSLWKKSSQSNVLWNKCLGSTLFVSVLVLHYKHCKFSLNEYEWYRQTS